MKPRPKHIDSHQAVDPRDDPRLLSTKAHYLKHLTLAFLAEVETLEVDRHLGIEDGLCLRDEVRRFEIDLIKYALQRADGNQTRAAVLLGVKATTLNSKIKLYRLQTKLFRRVAEDESALLSNPSRSRPILANAIAEESGATAVN